ncbi:hypothetical protein A5784_15130 [Mycobacterium sp. 852013-50091_SCH5140682]|uniref:hypothetical protein n=1 Tax=Mycobacterium sp. 852013-50091_SCH5140682 TaxID=1834109 RepID=UPI0007E9DA6B|nr:hypothetical protein [Mycobacterium sp. 852013-50091_SCH5140682]OBC03233.1 hypothetical protein A5784_15130 [Mycobacterium sp. 852013-50091_SCH5140682]
MYPQPGTGPGVTRDWLAWSITSLVFALAGVALAYLPFGPVSLVVASMGLAVGVVAVLRARGVRGAPPAVLAGVVVSGLAIVLGAVTVLEPHLKGASEVPAAIPDSGDSDRYGRPNSDIDYIMANEVQADFGDFTADQRALHVKLTSKMDVAHIFVLTVGAFDNSGVQVASDSMAPAVLGPHATQAVTFAFRRSGLTAGELQTKHFKVVSGKSMLFGVY